MSRIFDLVWINCHQKVVTPHNVYSNHRVFPKGCYRGATMPQEYQNPLIWYSSTDLISFIGENPVSMRQYVGTMYE